MTAHNDSLKSLDALDTAGLLDKNALSDAERSRLAAVAETYAIAITPTIASLAADPNTSDAIARQFVPDPRELDRTPSECNDPIGDNLKSPAPGIVHRYSDRALLKLVGICPVYCRFCFRREMVGPANAENLSATQLDAALAYLNDHREIWEVIVTGGDPLILSPRRIAQITQALSKIEHIKVLRWHTRVPVVMPEHVSNELVEALQSDMKTVYVSLHANHAAELTPAAKAACARLINAGIPMVSQTVLLKGINDDAETLANLMRAFVETRIKPYYLHHPDLAPGTSHFRVPIAHGQAIVNQLRQNLSGLAQPTYVLDIPGAHGKVPIHANNSRPGTKPGQHLITDRHGCEHIYEDCCTGPTTARS